MKKLKAIFFDLDETLFDTSGCRPPAVEASFRVAAQQHPYLTLEAWRAISEAVKAEMQEFWLNASLSGAELLHEGSYRILQKLGIDNRELSARVSQAYYQAWLAHLRLYPEVLEVIRALKGRYQLGVISNGPSDLQRRKLKLFDLEKEFHPIVISGELGIAKPRPEIFQHALAQVGLAPEEALYVGDSPVYDIPGAQGAGMWAAWVNRNGLPVDNLERKPDYVIHDLRELVMCLEDRL